MRAAVGVIALVAGTASADPMWIDTPQWPAKTDSATLTWRVYPATDAKAPVELVVAIGGVQRSVKLAPQLGQLPAMYQHACGAHTFPLRRGELAQIAFEEGGFGGFVARVDGTALEIFEWNQSDGACDSHGQQVACPRHDKLAARMHVPAGVKLVEHLEVVDGKGARHPFGC